MAKMNACRPDTKISNAVIASDPAKVKTPTPFSAPAAWKNRKWVPKNVRASIR